MTATDPTDDRDVPAEPPRRTRARAAWRAAGVVAAVAALVHPIASALSRSSWLADLISHFQGPALVVTLVACALLAARHRRVAAGYALLALVQAAPIVRYSGANPVPPDPRTSDRLRVLMVNVLYENEDYEGVERLIRGESPDVVGLVEYTAAWGRGLAAVRERYPYRREIPAGASGLALWFRDPPGSIDPPEWLVDPLESNPVIHATFEFAGRLRHLWLVHPTSPMLRANVRPGNREMAAIAARVGSIRSSRIVVGDMNSTEGSAHFRDFLRASGLRDSRLGFGRQGSWPTDWPYRIAIDHAFVSDDLAVVDRRLGPFVGSDHFPLIVELAPAATNAATQSASSR